MQQRYEDATYAEQMVIRGILATKSIPYNYPYHLSLNVSLKMTQEITTGDEVLALLGGHTLVLEAGDEVPVLWGHILVLVVVDHQSEDPAEEAVVEVGGDVFQIQSQ